MSNLEALQYDPNITFKSGQEGLGDPLATYPTIDSSGSGGNVQCADIGCPSEVAEGAEAETFFDSNTGYLWTVIYTNNSGNMQNAHWSGTYGQVFVNNCVSCTPLLASFFPTLVRSTTTFVTSPLRLDGQGDGLPTQSIIGARVTDLLLNEVSGELFKCTVDTFGSQEWIGSQGTFVPKTILAFDHPDLLAMYTMDNISGSTLVDESPNANNGTITGASAVAGKIGNAMNFTGHSDEVDLPAVSRDFTNGSGNSVWVNFDSHNAAVDWILDDQNSGGLSNTHREAVRWRPTQGDFEVLGGDGTSYYIYSFPYTLPSDGTYFHVVWGVASDGTPYLHVNGVAISGTLVSGTLVSPLTTSETIKLAGAKYTNTDRSFNGKLDQYRRFNRVLTQPEVTALYNEGTP